MPKTQPSPISPQQPGEAGATDFAVGLQRNFTSLFQDAHDHNGLTAEPGDVAGTVGDLRVVQTPAGTKLVAKTPDGWYASGRLFALGNEPWDDLRFPVTGINPPGGVSDPGRDPTDGTLVFDGAKTEEIAGIAQLPHGWKEGSAIYPHVHWAKTTSGTGTVLWRLYYSWANVGDVFPALSSAVTGTVLVSDSDTAEKHAITSFGRIAGTGKTVSSIIKWKVDRVGGTDTYADDARLLEFDIHFQIDGNGSETAADKE